ncbi:serine hydrolase domain-containing protein [Microbacterium thalassium]|uniref:CubicO group peptidase (Beta-lactamase class C family) n=1 Tax=Microbacterium thalassium TaxID=362649 RepID=A0A7X0KW02_9MICO|nr:serine hydrolase domain-containing protein [Microbacterium thalassium]MBB6392718.1 CubicO group peptidase (beta-lactamase class C family) [Microbacterium thalassium]GLK23050.1 hypothetical protein GCM10017607_03680 [Microbacterium thalassium]
MSRTTPHRTAGTSFALSPEALDAAVDGILHRHPTVGFALGVVDRDGLRYFRGHGVADLGTRRPITEDTGFRIASISKTFTAVAVMQLVEQGRIDLDAPANDYLRAYRLVPDDPDWRPATPRHLLTHTAGLGELAHASGAFRPDFGESVPAGAPLPSPADLYERALAVHAEPGTRFVYNNHGPTTLGQIVADVSGMPLGEYLAEHVFAPLGMSDSSLARTDRISAALATGYEIGAHGVKRVDGRDMITAGAASVYSTPRDMARYAQALLRGGAGEHGAILALETLAEMFRAQYRPDPRIPGMGLGFFRTEVAGRDAVRHQGTHPGFHSELCVVPDAGIGVIAFTNGSRQADFWLPSEVKMLLRTLLGDTTDAVPAAQHPERWGDLCGWYRLDARLTDVRLRGMLGFGAEVFVQRGRLMLRFLTVVPTLLKGFPLEPAAASDPDAFQVSLGDAGLEPMRVVFSRDPGTELPRLHLDMMPLTLEKQPDRTNPRTWANVALATAGVAVGATMLGRRAVPRTRRSGAEAE